MNKMFILFLFFFWLNYSASYVLQDQDQDSYWWNAETTITHQDLWLGN